MTTDIELGARYDGHAGSFSREFSYKGMQFRYVYAGEPKSAVVIIVNKALHPNLGFWAKVGIGEPVESRMISGAEQILEQHGAWIREWEAQQQ